MKFFIGLLVVAFLAWQYGVFDKIRSIRAFAARKKYINNEKNNPGQTLKNLADTKDIPALAEEIAKSDNLTLLQYVRLIDMQYFDIHKRCTDHMSEDPRILTIYAQSLIDKAWDARGGGYASTVSAEGARTFEDCLHKAENTLNKVLKTTQNIPLAYALMITVQMGVGSKEIAYEHFKEAKKRFPNDIKIHLDMIKLLTPRWMGDQDEVEKFIRDITATNNSYIMQCLISALHLEHMLGEKSSIRRNYFKDKTIRNEILDAFSKFEKETIPTDPYEAQNYYMGANIFAFIAIDMRNTKLGRKAFKLADNNPSPYPWTYFTDDWSAEFFKAKSIM